MPAIIPFIPLIAAGISVGAPLAEKAIAGDPNAAAEKQLQTEQTQQKAQQALTAKEAVLNQAPSIQSQVGGAVAPEYYIQEAAKETGNAGEENLSRQALEGFLGLSGANTGPSAGGSNPPTSSSPGIFELLSSFGSPGSEVGVSGGSQ